MFQYLRMTNYGMSLKAVLNNKQKGQNLLINFGPQHPAARRILIVSNVIIVRTKFISSFTHGGNNKYTTNRVIFLNSVSIVKVSPVRKYWNVLVRRTYFTVSSRNMKDNVRSKPNNYLFPNNKISLLYKFFMKSLKYLIILISITLVIISPIYFLEFVTTLCKHFNIVLVEYLNNTITGESLAVFTEIANKTDSFILKDKKSDLVIDRYREGAKSRDIQRGATASEIERHYLPDHKYDIDTIAQKYWDINGQPIIPPEIERDLPKWWDKIYGWIGKLFQKEIDPEKQAKWNKLIEEEPSGAINSLTLGNETNYNFCFKFSNKLYLHDLSSRLYIDPIYAAMKFNLKNLDFNKVIVSTEIPVNAQDGSGEKHVKKLVSAINYDTQEQSMLLNTSVTVKVEEVIEKYISKKSDSKSIDSETMRTDFQSQKFITGSDEQLDHLESEIKLFKSFNNILTGKSKALPIISVRTNDQFFNDIQDMKNDIVLQLYFSKSYTRPDNDDLNNLLYAICQDLINQNFKKFVTVEYIPDREKELSFLKQEILMLLLACAMDASPIQFSRLYTQFLTKNAQYKFSDDIQLETILLYREYLRADLENLLNLQQCVYDLLEEEDGKSIFLNNSRDDIGGAIMASKLNVESDGSLSEEDKAYQIRVHDFIYFLCLKNKVIDSNDLGVCMGLGEISSELFLYYRDHGISLMPRVKLDNTLGMIIGSLNLIVAESDSRDSDSTNVDKSIANDNEELYDPTNRATWNSSDVNPENFESDFQSQKSITG
jgi:hypothetical protein